jgi:hypothetical protein
MKENAKREMLDAVAPLLGASWAMPAQSCVGLAAAGIRRKIKIMLPEISYFRKVAQ